MLIDQFQCNFMRSDRVFRFENNSEMLRQEEYPGRITPQRDALFCKRNDLFFAIRSDQLKFSFQLDRILPDLRPIEDNIHTKRFTDCHFSQRRKKRWSFRQDPGKLIFHIHGFGQHKFCREFRGIGSSIER